MKSISSTRSVSKTNDNRTRRTEQNFADKLMLIKQVGKKKTSPTSENKTRKERTKYRRQMLIKRESKEQRRPPANDGKKRQERRKHCWRMIKKLERKNKTSPSNSSGAVRQLSEWLRLIPKEIHLHFPFPFMRWGHLATEIETEAYRWRPYVRSLQTSEYTCTPSRHV